MVTAMVQYSLSDWLVGGISQATLWYKFNIRPKREEGGGFPALAAAAAESESEPEIPFGFGGEEATATATR